MKFNVGRIVITTNCLAFCEPNAVNVYRLMVRHACCDWGDLVQADKDANARGLIDGERLLSAYRVAEDKIYIITEADRSYTTVMMASDY